MHSALFFYFFRRVKPYLRQIETGADTRSRKYVYIFEYAKFSATK